MFKCPYCLQKTFSLYSKFSLGTPHNPVEKCSNCGKNVTKSLGLSLLAIYISWIIFVLLIFTNTPVFVNIPIIILFAIIVIETIFITIVFPLKKDEKS